MDRTGPADNKYQQRKPRRGSEFKAALNMVSERLDNRSWCDVELESSFIPSQMCNMEYTPSDFAFNLEVRLVGLARAEHDLESK